MSRQDTTVNRRSFLETGSRAMLLLPIVGFGIESWACAGASSSPTQVSELKDAAKPTWRITIVPENEPGEPLIVSGTIYDPTGRTPLPGINLFVYQTDATGHYSPRKENDGNNRNTRVHGLMQTNAEGRYEFRTIKPAPYPGRTNPAHIHAYVSGPGYPEYWIDEFLFEGDPYLTAEMKQKFGGKGNQSSILQLTRDSAGTLRGVRDIVIERCSKNCTGQ
jgi:protocatechuate 3,4-dioxygenase beta subunit